MALNNTTIKDNFNKYEDWIEIYNPNNFSITLTGYKLTDNPLIPNKWIFPETSEIPAKGYLLIWASNNDTVAGGQIHTNFKLDGAGEFIGLSSPTQNYIDSITFGPQTTDISYGRKPDGTSTWIFFQQPTPGISNDSTSNLPVSTPDFSHLAGIYTSPFQLTLTHPIGNASIYYTLDGSNPTTLSNLYSSPISINSNQIVRAIAEVPGRVKSKIASASYFFQPDGDLPILSIVTDPKNFFDPDSGIYINYDSTGIKWERFVTLQYFDRTSISNFSVDCGIRIHGGYTRPKEKKSLRLYFRSDYGNPTLDYNLFKNTNVNKFDVLVLKSGSNDMVKLSPRWTLIRDQMITDLFTKTNGYCTHGNYTRVYLNGQPFGIFNFREHIDKAFLKDYMGTSDADLRENWEQKLGDTKAWDTLWAFMFNNPVLDSTKYSFVEQRIDADNYIDYFAYQIYAGDFDWPHNNLFFARDRSGGKWKWILWDIDQTFAIYDFGPYNTLAWALRDTVRTDLLYYDFSDLVSGTIFPRRLFSNETFKAKFISRFTDLLNTEFQSTNVLRVLDSLKNHLNADISFEINKWGGLYSYWLANIDTVRFFIQGRVDSLRKYVRGQFGITSMRNITVNNIDVSKGTVWINNLHVKTSNFSGQYFKGMKITVSAAPSVGYKFVAWTDTSLPQTATFTKTVTQDFYLQPIFELDASPIAIQPNDVIINEYWLNDNGTRYSSIDNRPIQGTWIELLVTKNEGVDLRGWRITNNSTKTKKDPLDMREGSIIFNQLPELSRVSKGTHILVITEIHPSNDYYFPQDDLDTSDSTMIFYVRNNKVNTSFDSFFNLRDKNDRIALLHPGKSDSFVDDIGIDFISEGDSITPSSFGISSNGVNFFNPFVGIGDDDGAIFANSAIGIYNNDNGADPIPGDNYAGQGGWIVDPSKEFSGDDPTNPSSINILTPGKKNYGLTTGVKSEELPKDYALYQNFPNPFNPSTKIRFSLPKEDKVEMKIYDILGREIASLLNENKDAGTYEISFNTSDYNLASGVYILNTKAGKFSKSIKMLLIK